MEQAIIFKVQNAADPSAVPIKAHRDDLVILHIFAGQSDDMLGKLFDVLRKAAIVPMDFAFTRESKTIVIRMHVDRRDVPSLKRIVKKIENLPSVTLVDLLDTPYRSVSTAC